MADLASRQVAWFEVHQFVQDVLSVAGSWPAAGSPAWCQLNDDDPRKLAAVLDAGQHWALRIDTLQAARAQASQDISRAVDCRQLARDVINHESIRIRRAAS